MGEKARSLTLSSGCALSGTSFERSPDVLEELAAAVPLPKMPDILVGCDCEGKIGEKLLVVVCTKEDELRRSTTAGAV